MELIYKYFPELSHNQYRQFSLLSAIYNEWNQKINVISRKDMPFLYERHILHSLSIARFINFRPNTIIADIGTGGGFPGIPLAIAFPDSNFILIDSIAKKIKVVNEVFNHIGLLNVSTKTERAENLHFKSDFIVSRAVTSLPEFYKMTSHLLKKKTENGVQSGIIYLKGGEFDDEIKVFQNAVKITNISDYFEETFFDTKKLVYISQVNNR